jgi:hypothetical protein
MRPNFTFGPLDSVGQYLLYLSIVVVGVLLPLLLQKWREHRDNAERVDKTLSLIAAEIEVNLDRGQKSLITLNAFSELLRTERLFLETQWRSLVGNIDDKNAANKSQVVVREGEGTVMYAALQRTAWDVACVTNVLSLLPSSVLMSLTSLYRGQTAYEEARSIAVSLSVRSNVHSLPIDLSSRTALEARLELTTHLASAVDYVVGSLKQLETLFISAAETCSKGGRSK